MGWMCSEFFLFRVPLSDMYSPSRPFTPRYALRDMRSAMPVLCPRPIITITAGPLSQMAKAPAGFMY